MAKDEIERIDASARAVAATVLAALLSKTDMEWLEDFEAMDIAASIGYRTAQALEAEREEVIKRDRGIAARKRDHGGGHPTHHKRQTGSQEPNNA